MSAYRRGLASAAASENLAVPQSPGAAISTGTPKLTGTTVLMLGGLALVGLVVAKRSTPAARAERAREARGRAWLESRPPSGLDAIEARYRARRG